ncbi:hypothetical protein KC460_00860 [Candidatus Dependentiae bacterium]|nr:hypothetical protein [Candidatus Dependentiae bacterium]
MKKERVLERQYRMLSHLSHLPRRILSLAGTDNITEFVLYDLCGKDCFNLKKAAYFIDNPDFNCLKGIAGFSHQEADACSNKWQEPDTFTCYMRECPFNKQVREVQRCSVKGAKESDEQIASDIARSLGFSKHKFCSWNMKHDNHGFFIYEPADEDDSVSDEYLLNGLCMLSFCPVF